MKLWIPLSLLVAVVVLAAGAVYFTVKYLPQTPSQTNQKPQMVQTTKPNVVVQANVMVEPLKTTVSVGEETEYQVKITAPNSKVVAIQADFNYNPKAIEVLSIIPGPLLPDPDILLEQISPETGKISYAVGTKQPVAGEGVAFNIRVKPLISTPQTSPLLTIDQQNTKVALHSIDGKKQYSESETKIMIKELSLSVSP